MSLIFVWIFRDVNYFFIPGTHILHLSFTTQHTLIKQISGICVLLLNFSLDIYFWTSDGYIRAPPYSNFSRARNLTPKFWIIFDDNEKNYDLVLLTCLFESQEQIFSYLATVTITGNKAANLDLCLALTAFSSEGSFTCHTFSISFQLKSLRLTWNISKSKNKSILIVLKISDYLRGRYGIYRDLC
jgi:hypothetical protein